MRYQRNKICSHLHTHSPGPELQRLQRLLYLLTCISDGNDQRCLCIASKRLLAIFKQ
jgi:hypothetical protein